MSAEDILKEFVENRHIPKQKAVTTYITKHAQRYAYPELEPNNVKTTSYYYIIDETDLLELIKSLIK